jgi:phosphonatase-like hydrolase
MKAIRVKAVMFDLIGTTVLEKNSDVINICFENAFSEFGIKPDKAIINRNRGKNKKEMITNILRSLHHPDELTNQIYGAFEKQVELNVHMFYENNGARLLFEYLHERKVKVALGSGLPRNLFEQIIHHLQWDLTKFDYIGISEEVGKSRPDPAMILDMMKKLNISDPTEVLKIGDTVADIQEGHNAKVYTAALLSGTQPDNDLIGQKPDFVLRSINDLHQIIQ